VGPETSWQIRSHRSDKSAAHLPTNPQRILSRWPSSNERSLLRAGRSRLWRFRDRGGAQVDLVLEHPDGRVCGIEVKATSTPRTEHLRGLRYLTAAPEATPFGPRLAALPLSSLWTR
jgi:hypothetical protein